MRRERERGTEKERKKRKQVREARKGEVSLERETEKSGRGEVERNSM